MVAGEAVEEVFEGFDTAQVCEYEPCYTQKVQLVPSELPFDPEES